MSGGGGAGGVVSLHQTVRSIINNLPLIAPTLTLSEPVPEWYTQRYLNGLHCRCVAYLPP